MVDYHERLCIFEENFIVLVQIFELNISIMGMQA